MRLHIIVEYGAAVRPVDRVRIETEDCPPYPELAHAGLVGALGYVVGYLPNVAIRVKDDAPKEQETVLAVLFAQAKNIGRLSKASHTVLVRWEGKKP